MQNFQFKISNLVSLEYITILQDVNFEWIRTMRFVNVQFKKKKIMMVHP